MKNITTNIFRGIFITTIIILISAISLPRGWYPSEYHYLTVRALLGVIAATSARTVIKFSLSMKMKSSGMDESLRRIYNQALTILPLVISLFIAVIILSNVYQSLNYKMLFLSIAYLGSIIDFIFFTIIAALSAISIKEETEK